MSEIQKISIATNAEMLQAAKTQEAKAEDASVFDTLEAQEANAKTGVKKCSSTGGISGFFNGIKDAIKGVGQGIKEVITGDNHGEASIVWGITGAASGAAVGSLLGPLGIIDGAIIGGILGGGTGKAVDNYVAE